jgi:hypothetical protein
MGFVVRTLETSEAIEWCKFHSIHLDDQQRPDTAARDLQRRRFEIPSRASQHAWFCNFIENSLRPWRGRCLFWVTAWGIWESSENWHLYYRLRESYGDRKLIEEAPAHLFLSYESSDLISFLQIALSMGWDFYVLTEADYSRVFVSHDEWIEFTVRGGVELERLTAEMAKAEIKPISVAG